MPGVLPKQEILLARDQGLIEFNDEEIGATSIDIKVDRLFRQIKQNKALSLTKEIPFLDLFEEIRTVNGVWILSSSEFYIARSKDQIKLGEGFYADLSSRSGWARYGVACWNTSQELIMSSSFEEREIIPEFAIKTFNTEVYLREGDSPAQIRFIHKHPNIVYNNKEIKLTVKKSFPLDQTIEDSEFALTLDRTIKEYIQSSGIIDPREDSSKHFREIDISGGFVTNPNSFYIASSREFVRIPKEYIGHLHLTNYSGQQQFQTHPLGIITQMIHANAPFIDPFPAFEGKVIFEIKPAISFAIYPGDKLTNLTLLTLNRPYRSSDVSRYKGQDGPKTSLNHL